MAIAKAVEILEIHQPAPLPKDVLNNLEEIRAKAEADLKDKHFNA
jgi:hypothetical protein